MIIKGLPVSCSESTDSISNIEFEYYDIKKTAKKYLFKTFSVDIPFDNEQDTETCKAEYIGNSRIDGTPMFDIAADSLGSYIFNGGLLNFIYKQDDITFTIIIKDLRYVNSISCVTVKYQNEKYTRFDI